MPFCSVIIKTHNSENYLGLAMDALRKQQRPADKIVIVDSASKNPQYLTPYATDAEILVTEEDIGFCRGNNLGVEKVWEHSDYILFLNPDAFMTPSVLKHAVEWMEKKENSRVAVLTGALHGYDITRKLPTGFFDSTGIFQSWYGKWFDRYQGQKVSQIDVEEVPAVCGAFMFCRKKALEEVLLRSSEVFDNSFYMYKEDIDLSLRLRKRGWKLFLDPALIIYHCRGWKVDRRQMPRRFRLCSAKNELRIHARSFSAKTCYSFAKYAAVLLFDL